MNLPNKITMFRVLLIPIFLVMYMVPGIPYQNYWSAGIFILASVTDWLDGDLARKWKLVTNFGKFMDPLADKLLVCSALVCFVEKPEVPMPAWVVIVIISREFIISGYRLVAADNDVVIAAGWWGKWKTFAQMVMSILLIVHLDAPFWLVAEQAFIYLSLVLTVLSLIDYLWRNRSVISAK